jgi:hypothetical protein
MQIDSGSESKEKTVTKKQYIAFAIGFVLFVPAVLLSLNIFGTPKYGELVPVAMIVYIGISSIVNRVSVLRIRGKREPSKGKQALTFGIILLGVAAFTLLTIFVPSLSNIFFPF